MINLNNVKDLENFQNYEKFCTENKISPCRIESIESYFNSKKGA